MFTGLVMGLGKVVSCSPNSEGTVVALESKELAPEIRVIIPHLGGLNGGYKAIADYGLWDRPGV